MRENQLLFETAHLKAFHVEHFAESRVGFYFKELNEYGLYGFFAANDDDVFHSYYRTDSTFQKEEMLLAVMTMTEWDSNSSSSQSRKGKPELWQR